MANLSDRLRTRTARLIGEPAHSDTLWRHTGPYLARPDLTQPGACRVRLPERAHRNNPSEDQTPGSF